MPKYTVYRDAFGFATAIEKDEVVLLHLVEGSKRNEKEVDAFVDRINALEQALENLVNDPLCEAFRDEAIELTRDQDSGQSREN